MRITILTAGSHGDIQPFVALGQGLQRAGYAVRLVTTHDFERFVLEHGLEYAPVEGDFRALVLEESGHGFFEAGTNPVQYLREGWRIYAPLMAQLFSAAWRATEDADALICSVLGVSPGFHVARERGIPCFEALLVPLRRTRSAPFFSLPDLRIGLYNWLPHTLFEEGLWLLFRQHALHWQRRTLNTRPRSPLRRPMHLPVLVGYSPLVVPKRPDWGDNVHVTGYWFLNAGANWQPPPGLADFLDAGPPPVSVGFGSMASSDPAWLAEVALEALRRSGQRGILLTGWGGIRASDTPDDVFVIEAAPHDWLFARVAAAVHHGGAGTTGAALRAGIPSVIVPFFGDQRFWGQRVALLGAGPPPIPRVRLTAQRLAGAIKAAVTDTAIRQRAAALGAGIRTEDGVENAVTVIGQHVGLPASHPAPQLLERARTAGR